MARRRAIWTTNAIVNQDDRRTRKGAARGALSSLVVHAYTGHAGGAAAFTRKRSRSRCPIDRRCVGCAYVAVRRRGKTSTRRRNPHTARIPGPSAVDPRCQCGDGCRSGRPAWRAAPRCWSTRYASRETCDRFKTRAVVCARAAQVLERLNCLPLRLWSAPAKCSQPFRLRRT
jgi:hypothetical protein